MGFGERLRFLRTEKRITQKQFATLFKIAESTVSMYERGEREPSFEQLERIADYFDETIDYLMGRTDTRGKQQAGSEGRAFYGGGDDWTEEEHLLAQAAVEDWRRRKKEMEKKLQQNDKK